MRRRAHPLALVVLILGLAGAAWSAAPSQAHAEIPETLRPGTKPWFFHAGVGGAFNLDGVGSQTKFVQELGIHFSGDASGPALGVALAESVGSGFFVFQPGAKFWWDIQIIDDLGLYVAPFVKVGAAFATNINTNVFFNFQGGAQARLVINDLWNVFVRPVAIDFFIGENGLDVRYDFIVGGVLSF